MPMVEITETELVYAANFKVLKGIRIQQTHDRYYQIYVITADNPNEKMLVTAREKNAPREWVSLDRLVKHIGNKYRFFSNITLSLYNEKKGEGS